MRCIRNLLLVCSVLFALAEQARAQGIETTPNGSVALGRAASSLYVHDFMATWQNPANLAVIPGRVLGLDLRMPLLHACFDRAKDNSAEYRTTDPANGYAGSESFENVCNAGGPLPTGNVGWAQGFDSGWGYGVGIFTPTAVPNLAYGNDTIVTQVPLPDERYPTTPNGVESPTRFLLRRRTQLGAFLQAGAGVQLLQQLRVGLALGLGMANLRNSNVASVQGGTFRDQEVLTDVRVTDWAIPRATLSVVYAPIEALELLAGLTYLGDVHAKGHVDFTANGVQGAPLGDCRVASPASPGPHCRSDGAELDVPFPTWQAQLGVRYASRRAHRTRALDPLRDERWDIELNAQWSQTSHVDQYNLQLYDQMPGAPGSSRLAFSSSPNAFALPLPAQIKIPYHWRDTFDVRAGGDYVLLPGRLSGRLGISYESSAVPAAYMNIDAWPVSKLGLHVGATLALGMLKLTAAYAHLFYQGVDVAVGQGRVPEVVSQNQMAAQAVNEGNYRAWLDVVSLQANLTF